jgi:hypothetical protein
MKHDDERQGELRFSGRTYEPELDQERLSTEFWAVKRLMSDSAWRTLKEIRFAIGMGSEAGISARLRDFRKERFGSHTVNRRRRGEGKRGVFEYQLILNQQQPSRSGFSL